MALKFPCSFKSLRSCIRLLAEPSDRNMGQEGGGRDQTGMCCQMCLSARCGGVEGLAPEPGTQSMPLPCDSSELFPQHCSGKFRDHMVLRSPASASLWGPQAFVLTPKRVGFIEKESIIHLSASSFRNKKTKIQVIHLQN